MVKFALALIISLLIYFAFFSQIDGLRNVGVAFLYILSLFFAFLFTVYKIEKGSINKIEIKHIVYSLNAENSHNSF